VQGDLASLGTGEWHVTSESGGGDWRWKKGEHAGNGLKG
jgi:hypothetical protein